MKIYKKLIKKVDEVITIDLSTYDAVVSIKKTNVLNILNPINTNKNVTININPWLNNELAPNNMSIYIVALWSRSAPDNGNPGIII